MRQLLAVLGAVAMVALAVVVRGALDDGDDGSGDRAAVVLCSADLADVCAALGVEHELADAVDTYALAVAGDTGGVDAWLTTGAWVEVLQSRSPEVIGTTEVLASSPIGVAVDPVRAEAVRGLCRDRTLLGCLGEHAGGRWSELGGEAAWGTLKTGLPDVETGLGLAVLPAIAAGVLGRLDFAANDFEPGDLPDRLARLAEPSGAGDPNPGRTLVTRRGTYSAVADVSARLDPLADRVEHVVTTPEVRASVVLVTFEGSRRSGIAVGSGRDALVDVGWDRASGSTTSTLKPGVLAALLTLWTEITR